MKNVFKLMYKKVRLLFKLQNENSAVNEENFDGPFVKNKALGPKVIDETADSYDTDK